VSGLYALVTKRGDRYFLADCPVNIEPSAEDLAEIALCTAETARRFNVTPRMAKLSFSNFRSTPHPLTEKVQRAVKPVQDADPTLMIDGGMMAVRQWWPGSWKGRIHFRSCGAEPTCWFSGPDVGKHGLQATVVDWRSGRDR
jgi:hypothetical protein